MLTTEIGKKRFPTKDKLLKERKSLGKKRIPTKDELGKKRKSSIMIRKLRKKRKNAISISSDSGFNSVSNSVSNSDSDYNS